jgi:hypothetical protein
MKKWKLPLREEFMVEITKAIVLVEVEITNPRDFTDEELMEMLKKQIIFTNRPDSHCGYRITTLLRVDRKYGSLLYHEDGELISDGVKVEVSNTDYKDDTSGEFEYRCWTQSMPGALTGERAGKDIATERFDGQSLTQSAFCLEKE